MYRVDIRPSAKRSLRAIAPHMRRRIEGALALLAQDPRPPASRPLIGSDYWRVRIGDYRIIYRVDDGVLVVVVVAVGHRREVYERWHGE